MNACVNPFVIVTLVFVLAKVLLLSMICWCVRAQVNLTECEHSVRCQVCCGHQPCASKVSELEILCFELTAKWDTTENPLSPTAHLNFGHTNQQWKTSDDGIPNIDFEKFEAIDTEPHMSKPIKTQNESTPWSVYRRRWKLFCLVVWLPIAAVLTCLRSITA